MNSLLRKLAILGLSLGLMVTYSFAAHAAPAAKQNSFFYDSEELNEFFVDHSLWDELLKKYVSDHPSGISRFDYDGVTAADKARIEEYLAMLEQLDPRQMSMGTQKPYWLNLFNASLIWQVIDSEPETSIKEISSRVLWRKKRLYISMQDVSLDIIEHGILRTNFDDPRIHFGITGGTLGSANILNTAYTQENVEELLEQNTRDFLNQPRGLSFDKGRPTLSTIFKWYSKDFGARADDIKAFVAKYLSDEKKQLWNDARRFGYSYDWGLNKP